MGNLNGGQNVLARRADESGEVFFVGPQNPLSLKPFEQLETIWDGQYWLLFEAGLSKQAKLRSVDTGLRYPASTSLQGTTCW